MKDKKDEIQIEIKSKLKKIEEILQDIENKNVKYFGNSPSRFIELKKEEKIRFPRGIIRRKDNFKKRYNFENLFPMNYLLQNNLSYALQCSDIFGYFITRFDIGLSAGKIFFKMGIINLFSIIEGILYGVTKTLHNYCINCKNSKNCQYYIKSSEKKSFNEILDMLSEHNIFPDNDKIKSLLKKLKGLRDNIHIWDVDKNEFVEEDYTIETYNKLIKILHILREDLPKNIERFKKIRYQQCSKNKIEL